MIIGIPKEIKEEEKRVAITPAGVAAIDAGLIRNIARHEDRLLILLDIEKTLQIDR